MSFYQDPELVFTEWVTRRLTLTGSTGSPITILPSYLLINVKKKAIASIQMTMKMVGGSKYTAAVTEFAWRTESDLDHHGICTTLELAKQSTENALINLGYRRLEDKFMVML